MNRLTCSYAANLIADSGAILRTLMPFPRHKLLWKSKLAQTSNTKSYPPTYNHPLSACNGNNLRFFAWCFELARWLWGDQEAQWMSAILLPLALQQLNVSTISQFPSQFVWSHQEHSNLRQYLDTTWMENNDVSKFCTLNDFEGELCRNAKKTQNRQCKPVETESNETRTENCSGQVSWIFAQCFQLAPLLDEVFRWYFRVTHQDTEIKSFSSIQFLHSWKQSNT